jgi:hypothetical protein
VNASEFVTNRGNKRQNRKFRSNVTRRIAGPIDLRIRKTKTSIVKIPCNCRDVALPPAPVINEGLIDENQPNRHRENSKNYYDVDRTIDKPRFPDGFRSSL